MTFVFAPKLIQHGTSSARREFLASHLALLNVVVVAQRSLMPTVRIMGRIIRSENLKPNAIFGL